MISGEQSAFRALADPTRRQILMHLSQAEMSIGEVSDKFEMTRGAVKKHLSILEQGNLIKVRVQGRERINALEPKGMKQANEWLNYFNQFWDAKLDNLKSAVETHEQTKGNSTKGNNNE